MAVEDNKTVVRRLFEDALNRNNLALVDELMTPTYIEHATASSESSREAFKVWWQRDWRSAFPDWHFTLEDLLSEGDTVVARFTVLATHHGVFVGVAPTGKQVRVTGIHIFRLADHHIVEHWGNQDDLGLLKQLGATPA